MSTLSGPHDPGRTASLNVPPEPDPGDDDASEPAAPPSAAPPLREPPLSPVGGDWTGVCRIGLAPEDAQDGQEEVGEAGELDGADDEYDGAVTAGPPDADVGALAGALVALTGGLAAGARAAALDGAAAVVVSTDPRDTRRLGLYGAAGTSSELAEPTFAWLRAAVRLDAASLPERVLEELTAPMMSVRASSKTTSATRRRRRIVARLGRDGSLLIVATGEHNPTGPGRSRRQRPPSTMHPLSDQRSRNSVPSRPDSRRSRGTTSTIDADDIETCAGPEAEDALSPTPRSANHGTREFFTHVRARELIALENTSSRSKMLIM